MKVSPMSLLLTLHRVFLRRESWIHPRAGLVIRIFVKCDQDSIEFVVLDCSNFQHSEHGLRQRRREGKGPLCWKVPRHLLGIQTQTDLGPFVCFP